MKTLLIAACALLLAACSSAPVLQSSFGGASVSASPAPASPNDPRMLHPQFYMDESDSMSWLHAGPHNNQ